MKVLQSICGSVAILALTAACGSTAKVDDSASDTAVSDAATSELGNGDSAAGDTLAQNDQGPAADTVAADTGPADTGPADTQPADAAMPNDTAADAASNAPSCSTYCAAVTSSCKDANAQYKSLEDCMTYCSVQSKIPAGSLNDIAGNTLGCRLYHATVAGQSAENAPKHCPHAGKSGGNTCGTWCENFCSLSKGNCAADLFPFKDDAECQTKCAAVPMSGANNATAGNNVQCLIYHAGVAGTDANTAKDHCSHGKIPNDKGGPCTDVTPAPTCAAYCDAVTAACIDKNAQYKDKAECLVYCENKGKIPAGLASDVGGDTIGCRMYHASVAAKNVENALIHCPHTGKSGGNTCGTWCENYCQLAKSNCTGGANSLYADDKACMDKCAGENATGVADAVSGNTVQCRIYHLGVAGTDASTAKDHCPHGKFPNDVNGPCSGGDAPVGKNWPVATTAQNAFDPKTLMITVGDTVEFTTTASHDVVEVDKATFDTNGNTKKANGFSVDFNAKKKVTFSTPGTFYFVCEPHASMGMKGSITVQ